MEKTSISKTTARRFVLGKQGLWPGRRWQGKPGVVEAVNAIESVQMDPLNVVARSHDIVLWSRVADYEPDHLDSAMYRDREFFDYGGHLDLYPMSELPYWRLHMERCKTHARWADIAAEHADLIAEVQRTLRERGPLGNRDFPGYKRVNSYRGRKDTALALYYLWITGELMIHHRVGFERVYDFRDNVAPPEFNYAAPEDEAEQHFVRKPVAFYGLVRESEWRSAFSNLIRRGMDQVEAKQRLGEMLQEGAIEAVHVEGSRDRWYALAEDRAILAELEAERVPAEWQPIGLTSEDEVVFLAPLDIVSARGRALKLFEFEYIWEVYKPAAIRRWGYYTLPILYGDRLVARLDPRLDRTTSTLWILGFWLEDPIHAGDAEFVQAFARGLASFARFLNAERIDISAVQPAELREAVQCHLDTFVAAV